MKPKPRFPEFVGALNFRDMGGYLAADGRRTRWHTLYRSGTTHSLTVADVPFPPGLCSISPAGVLPTERPEPVQSGTRDSVHLLRSRGDPSSLNTRKLAMRRMASLSKSAELYST